MDPGRRGPAGRGRGRLEVEESMKDDVEDTPLVGRGRGLGRGITRAVGGAASPAPFESTSKGLASPEVVRPEQFEDSSEERRPERRPVRIASKPSPVTVSESEEGTRPSLRTGTRVSADPEEGKRPIRGPQLDSKEGERPVRREIASPASLVVESVLPESVPRTASRVDSPFQEVKPIKRWPTTRRILDDDETEVIVQPPAVVSFVEPQAISGDYQTMSQYGAHGYEPFASTEPELPYETSTLPTRLDAMVLHNRGRSSAQGMTGSVYQSGRSYSGSERDSTSGQNRSVSVPIAAPTVLPEQAAPSAQNAEAPVVRVAPVATLVEPVVTEKSVEIKVPVVRKGDKGDPTQLACNFLRLQYQEGKQRILEYHVDFQPNLDSRKQRRIAIEQFTDVLGEVRNFDGMMLFLPIKLPKKKLELFGLHPGDPSIQLAVTIQYVKEKTATQLVLFFNILFKKIMRKLKKVELRRAYYDLTAVVTLGQHKLEIWPGFCLAIEEREGGLMLCLDASHRVLRTDTVHDYMHSIKGTREDWRELFNDFIVGKIVLTRYNNMCYKIDDVIWDTHPTAVFMKGEEEISYVEYYSRMYSENIKDLSQPLLLSKVKARRARDGMPQEEDKMVALVPELCYVTGLTDEQRTNFTVMKDLGDHTRLSPPDRRKALEQFVKAIEADPEAKKCMTEWNLEMDTKPFYLQGRKITGPKLNFGRLGDVSVGPDFTREATQSCHEPVDVQKYLVVCTQRDADKAKQFVEMYKQVASALAIKTLGGAVILPIKGYQVNDFRRAIKENLTSDMQFLLVVMPQQREDIYSLIKKTCVSELGVPSQVVLTKTLSNEKRLKSVVQKIALQINCKLGGSLWALNMPLKEQVMFVGIDVCHDAKRKHPSVLAMVVNLDNQCTKYHSLVRIMRVHQEVSDHLESAFTEALKAFYEVRGLFPGRIIVWRDGGSISSVNFFKEYEVGQMQKAIDLLCPAASFSFVVIQKRIAQRFFQTNRMGQNWKNPDPGTVVDHTVTARYNYDFFVVPQLVRQGTVTPTHYVVVSETTETKPDLMQKLAYVTSFMYFNWSGTVRVPAMTQYAHKLAALVGQYVRAPPGKPLIKTLYYL